MIFNDSLWSILALVIMNMVAQFVVYPFWAKQFGAETYGNILYLLAYINILAVSGGSALNYARMASSARGQTNNGEYNLIMLTLCGAAVPFCFAVQHLSGVPMDNTEVWVYWVLLCTTMWRNYIDVDFRLSLNYKGYFKYYMCISAGYVFGVVLIRFVGMWEFALLPGEIAGILYVFLRGDNLRKKMFVVSPRVRNTLETCLIMLATNFILNIIFNADRFMLKALIGGTAVTIYYLSSLMGKTVSLITTPLNSVIISYLARYQGDFTRSMFRKLLLVVAGAAVVLVVGCVAGSYLLIWLFYPDSYAMTKEFFLISSLSQVIFFATSVLTVVLLRFAKQSYQLYINLIYAVFFVLLGIPMTKSGGIWGFSYAILLANLGRMAASMIFGLCDQLQRAKVRRQGDPPDKT